MINRRQDEVFDDGGRRVFICDKACRTVEIIKWSILLGLFALFFLWVTVGYWHARRRLKKGLPLLKYHKWLAPRSAMPQNSYGYYSRPQYGYGMQNFAEPPPMYNPAGMPPAYAPPPGGSKVAPQQSGFIPQQPSQQGAPQMPPPAL